MSDNRARLRKRATAARLLLALVPAALAIALGSASAGAQSRGPGPEPNTAADLTAPRPCALDSRDPYEKRFYEAEGWKAPSYERYPGACERLRFAYGPILVKPGQNDVLVTPVTIDKPNRDGYITRIKPNLVRPDGTVPPVEQVHLHHGTWLSEPSYGSGPFFAAGEEKTIAPYPRGYGMPIRATDQWQLLYMVHSAIPNPMQVYITYDVDFIPKAKAEKIGIKPAYPVWLDVRPSGYPVFNVQRKYGGPSGRCTWPTQQCADLNPWGDKELGQGEPGNGKGTDLVMPKAGGTLGLMKNFRGGTLIGIGGHVHPGGIQNEIDLVRPGGELVTKRVPVGGKTTTRNTCAKRKHGKCVKRRTQKVRRYRTVTTRVDRTRIYNGRAHYWNYSDPSRDGGPPTSWDFSMAVEGLPRWGVHVKPGDLLRSNALYDTTHQASYEDMGIAVTLMAPDTADGKPTAPGVDPFQAPRDHSQNCQIGPAKGRLCDIGVVTHGHYAENGNHSGPGGQWTGSPGPPTNQVAIADFQYTPGDLSTKSTFGVPTVKLGTDLRFTNAEGTSIYHTVTTCAFPCLGKTGSAFPISNGRTSGGRAVDFDSSELGIGAPYVGATSQKIQWDLPVTPQTGFKPGETVTYFCRIHPFMRGAFQVTP